MDANAADGGDIEMGSGRENRPALLRSLSTLRNARNLQAIRYGSQRLIVWAKLAIMFLVRVLLLTWIIIAYFMIRSMEFKN